MKSVLVICKIKILNKSGHLMKVKKYILMNFIYGFIKKNMSKLLRFFLIISIIQ